MSITTRSLGLLTGMLVAFPAHALTIDFDDLSPGEMLGSQYAGLGVTFSANGFSGPGSSSSGEFWAANTDLTVVSLVTGVAGEDYGALGSPGLVANNILRRYEAWLYDEDGDPSFSILLNSPASKVEVVFAGIEGASTAADTRLFAYAGSLLVGSAAASWPDETVAQLSLIVAAPAITSVVIAPGSYLDWVAVDQISITPVPEPGRWALMAIGVAGLCGVAGVRRRIG